MKNIGAIVLLLILSCSDYRPVARVGNYVISSESFLESFLDDKSLEQAQKLSDDKRLEHLQKMIDDKLVLMEARRRGLENDPEVLRRIKAFEEQLLVREVFDKEIVDPVIPDELIREEYSRQAREVKFSHIFLPKTENGAFEYLRGLRKQIIRQGQFEQFAEKVSKDSLTAGKGGDLGFVKWGARDFGEDFYKQVFKLREGQLSQPIESAVGFHLVKVDKFRTIPQSPYHLARETIRQKLIRKQGNKLQEQTRRFIDNLRALYNVSVSEEALELVWMKLEENRSDRIALNRIFSEEEKSIPIVVFQGGSYDIGRFVAEFKVTPSSLELLKSKEQLTKYVYNIFPKELIVSWAYKKGFNKSRHVKTALSEKEEQLMVERLEERREELYEQYDDGELAQYFEANKEKYKTPEKYKVQEILVDSYQVALEIKAKSKGVSFDSLAQAFNTRPTTRGNNGMLGFISSREYGAIGQAAGKMNVGQISNPIKMGDKYSVIKVIEKKEETIPLLENLKPRVIADLKRTKRLTLRESWIDSLRSSTTVAVYRTNIEKVFDTL